MHCVCSMFTLHVFLACFCDVFILIIYGPRFSRLFLWCFHSYHIYGTNLRRITLLYYSTDQYSRPSGPWWRAFGVVLKGFGAYTLRASIYIGYQRQSMLCNSSRWSLFATGLVLHGVSISEMRCYRLLKFDIMRTHEIWSCFFASGLLDTSHRLFFTQSILRSLPVMKPVSGLVSERATCYFGTRLYIGR